MPLYNPTLNASIGDLNQKSFSASNNTSSVADVTGLVFSTSTVRSFKVLLSVYVDATTDLFEAITLQGVYKGSTWEMVQTGVGDNSEFVFTITNAGQIQYVNGNYTGFSSAVVKFRAFTTAI